MRDRCILLERRCIGCAHARALYPLTSIGLIVFLKWKPAFGSCAEGTHFHSKPFNSIPSQLYVMAMVLRFYIFLDVMASVAIFLRLMPIESLYSVLASSVKHGKFPTVKGIWTTASLNRHHLIAYCKAANGERDTQILETSKSCTLVQSLAKLQTRANVLEI